MGKRITIIAIGVAALILVVGIGYFSTVDFPPDREKVEKVIPDDRLAK